MADDSPAKPLRVGTLLYGYCGGYFGRGSYGLKRIEAIGADWVVAREGDTPVFYEGDPDILIEYTIKPADWDDD